MPNSKPIRFAVVGAGMIGELHAKVIAAMNGGELRYVFSRSMERARKLSDVYGGDPVTDYADLLRKQDCDAVSICTASGEHADFGIAAAEAGKHVLVEKPIEISPARADALIEACDSNGVKLGVVFQLRFLDASAEVKQAMQQGVLGDPVMADCTMKFFRPQSYYDNSRWKGTLAMDGGGALINQGIHGLDLLLHLAGDIATVKAYTGVLAHTNIEVEDTCVAAVRYMSGALGVIRATTSVQPDVQQRIALHGTQGTIVLEGTEDTWIRQWETTGEQRECVVPEPVEHAGAAAVLDAGGQGHARQVEDFVAAINGDRAPAVDGLEGRRSLAVVTAVYASARSGSEETVDYRSRGR